MNKACFLNNSDDVQKYIKLLCQESHRTLIFITESLHIKNESFINYEELLSKIKLGNKYKNVDLSKIPEIDDEKTSDKQDKIPSFSSKISRDASEIIKKSKRCDETDYNNDSNGNIDEEDNESSLLDKNYKSMKFNVFPGPTIRNLSEIGSDIKNFQLYYMKEYKDEDYPFDSGLKCNII